MKIKLISQKGKEIEEQLTLDKEVWGLSSNDDLVAQALFVYNSNQRRSTANAKTRGQVSGGGRKPWRQKGTGRARAGSSRSPVWIKGGVTFVPNDRNWGKRINEKMKKKAIATALSTKLQNGEIKFVKFAQKGELKNIREDILKISQKIKTLVVSEQENVLKAVQNVTKFKVSKPIKLNIYESLDNNLILIDADSVKIIETRLKNGK